MALGQQENKPVAVVDADRVVYLAALLACDADTCPTQGEPVLNYILNQLKRSLKTNVPNWSPRRTIYCLSTQSFRHDILPTYKENRKGRWSPPQRGILHNTFLDMVDAWEYDKYEADDLVGILGSKIPHCVVVSNDKDLDQIPGQHYDPAKNRYYSVTPEEARYMVYYQWIRGDSGDGYTGIPKWGPVKTEKFLKEIKINEIDDDTAKRRVAELYKNAGIPEQCDPTLRVCSILTEVLGTETVQGGQDGSDGPHQDVASPV